MNAQDFWAAVRLEYDMTKDKHRGPGNGSKIANSAKRQRLNNLDTIRVFLQNLYEGKPKTALAGLREAGGAGILPRE